MVPKTSYRRQSFWVRVCIHVWAMFSDLCSFLPWGMIPTSMIWISELVTIQFSFSQQQQQQQQHERQSFSCN